jgi:UDP-N-acetylglucosamine 2-epimerase (non-hydrolysing)
MMTVLTIVGTRPEAIKMAPVIRQLQQRSGRIRSVVCSTGQHREMLQQALDLFDIRPDIELDLMEPNQNLSSLTAHLLLKLDGVYQEVKPDWVLAQGDTTSVFAASLVAYYHRLRFGHVEAGLRTGDRWHPFPEEINRRLADAMSDLYFCPTERAKQNLLAEGYPDRSIRVTGNTVIDALLDVASRDYTWADSPLADLESLPSLALITAHRRESFGEPFKELCLAIRELAETFARDGVHFVYPVHLNPNVRKPVFDILANVPNIHLLEPLPYDALVHLMKRSLLILTDSGGIQEEAPGLGVPVLVMRNTTERPEGVEAGVVRLVGTERQRIVSETARLLRDPQARSQMIKGVSPYGDGNASRRIVDAILEGVSP